MVQRLASTRQPPTTKMAAPGAGQQQPGAQDFKEEPGSRVVVHERVDSKSELDKLFAVVDTQHGPGGGAGPGAGGRPLQVPLKMRNLPASFWQPGPIGTKSPGQSHSRENSLDNSAPFSPGPAPTPPPNHHTRTSSCPPALGQLDRGAGAQHQVTRHCSYYYPRDPLPLGCHHQNTASDNSWWWPGLCTLLSRVAQCVHSVHSVHSAKFHHEHVEWPGLVVCSAKQTC